MGSTSKYNKLMKTATTSYHEGNYTKAVNLLHKLLLRYPNEPKISYYLGASYNAMPEKHNHAILFFARAIGLNPDEYEYFLGLASTLNELGERDDTLKIVDFALEAFPGLANAYSFKAFLLFDSGKVEEGINLAYEARKHPGYFFDEETHRKIKNHPEEIQNKSAKDLIDITDLLIQTDPREIKPRNNPTDLEIFLEDLILKYGPLYNKSPKTRPDDFSVLDLFNYYDRD